MVSTKEEMHAKINDLEASMSNVDFWMDKIKAQ